MAEEVAKERGLKPLARILGYEDAEVEPINFAIAPAKACGRLLKLLDIDPSRVNLHGGAVALGHPVGMSGARIILSLINVLRRNNGTIGMASICNGGGGSSAMLIERLN
jgi:acetyl-CoA C-acetyltransferase